MKIHSLSKVIYVPLGLLALAVWFFVPNDGNLKLYGLLISITLLACNYILSGEIDYWWQKRNPIGLDPKAIEWLERYSDFYNTLDEHQKENYENRLSLYLQAREFKQMAGEEKVEILEDFKIMIAHQAIELTFYKEDFLIGDFDRIYCYGHPFPTPTIQQLHTVETEVEDGIILLDIKHAMAGVTNPAQHYNIIMHAYVDAYLKINEITLPEIKTEDLAKIKLVAGYSIQQIVKVVGHHVFEPDVPMITLFFTYPEAFSRVFPKYYSGYNVIFKTIGLT